MSFAGLILPLTSVFKGIVAAPVVVPFPIHFYMATNPCFHMVSRRVKRILIKLVLVDSL